MKTLQIRYTEEQRRRWSRAAGKKSMNVEEWLVAIADDAAKGKTLPMESVLALIAAASQSSEDD